MTATQLELKIDFELVDCASCGLVFALQASYIARLREKGRSFYCPAGHTLSYGESELDRVRKQLEQTQRKLGSAEGTITHLRDQRDAAERSRAAHQAQATRLRNRVGKGVCPCCHRTFQDLQRHMSGKHPDFATADPEVTA